MYPTLSDLLLDLFGINIPLPIQSFGFFVALAFLAGSYFLSKELKRKERESLLKPTITKVFVGEKATMLELLTSGLIGFVVGFKLFLMILDYNGFVSDPQETLLSFNGNFFGGIIGAAVAGFMKFQDKNSKRLKNPKWVNQLVSSNQHAGNLVLICAVAGLLGAKIFHQLENWSDFINDPIGSLISFSGLTFYGGMITACIACVMYCKKNDLTPIHVFDVFAPVLLLSYGIGRIGCHVAGDGDWGIPNDAPMPDWLSGFPEWVWAYGYENNVLGWDLKEHYANMEVPLESLTGKAWPTPLYESVLNISFFVIIYSIREKITVPGVLFSIYLIINGVERFFIEKIRVNTTYDWGFITPTQAEIISTVFVILGIIGLIYLPKRHAAAINA